MSDHSLQCPVCQRPTLHRSTGAGFAALGLLAVIVAVAGVVFPPLWALLACIVPFTAICAVIVPPAAIRCQTCGGVTSRAWGMYVLRAGLVVGLWLFIHRAGQVAEEARRSERRDNERAAAFLREPETVEAQEPEAPTASSAPSRQWPGRIASQSGAVLWDREDHSADARGNRAGSASWGSLLTVIDERGDQYRVRLSTTGREGWVSRAAVERQSP